MYTPQNDETTCTQNTFTTQKEKEMKKKQKLKLELNRTK